MTSAEQLALFNELTGRKATDVITDATKYSWLAAAERYVIAMVTSMKPSIFYQKVGTTSLPQLLTADNNVFTFGVDVDDNPLVPYGHTQIYRNVRDVPDRPLIVNVDYLDEGTQIRLVRNRHHTGPLYWRGVVDPPPISSEENPHFVPSQANELTAIRAAQRFAAGGNIRNPALVGELRTQWAERYPYWCLLWKKQFSAGGALTSFSLIDAVTPLL